MVSARLRLPLSLPSRDQSGQIAVVILLIMAVLVTVGLSLATRSTQDVSLSTQQSESSRVLNAAETGIEHALSQYSFSQSTTGVTLDTADGLPEDVSVTYRVTQQPSQTLDWVIPKGEVRTVNLQGASGSTLTIRWSKNLTDTCQMGSLILAFYSRDNKIEYLNLGPNCPTRTDGFEKVSRPEGGYSLSKVITLKPQAQFDYDFVRIHAVYEQNLAVQAFSPNLPVQTQVIRSEARDTKNTAQDETRIVQVVRHLPAAPTFMDYALYTRGTIVK